MPFVDAAALRVDVPRAGLTALGVDREHDGLRAELLDSAR